MTMPASAPARTETDPRSLFLPLGLGLLLWGGIFHAEIIAAVGTWVTSTAYNHCFLVIPIALFLIRDRLPAVAGIQARPAPTAALLGLPVAAVWLLAERLGIMEGRQLAALTFAELLFFALLGPGLWRALLGPLLYLYFLVPFGEFLTPWLQDVTTFFIRHGLEVLGVPAYVDGYVIEIPQGTFFVAEACAGLRFLIASVAFGCLYALMMYRGPVRRGVFILVSVVVPVIANGVRGIGIVYLGYLLGSAQAAAADHLVYGWVFFSLVILLLIVLGLPFRQDEPALRRGARLPAGGRVWGGVASRMPWTVLAVTAVAAVAPAIAAGLAQAASRPVPTPAVIAADRGCSVRPESELSESPEIRTERVVCGEVAMRLAWQALSPRATAGSLMAARRRLCLPAETESHTEHWLETPGSPPSPWRIMGSIEPAYLTAVAVWIDGRAVRPGMVMRSRMALDSLFGASFTPMALAVAPDVAWGTMTPASRAQVQAQLESFLADHPELVTSVGALSALR